MEYKLRSKLTLFFLSVFFASLFISDFIYLYIVIYVWLDVFFTYISNVIPFPRFPSENALFHCPSPCSPTYTLMLPCPGIPLYWGIESSQDQGTLLPLMSNKAILCYIRSGNHGFLHVYSLVGGLVPGSSGGVLVGSYCCCFYGTTSSFSSLGPFSRSSIGDLMISSVVFWDHPPLHLSATGRASQETAISGYCQQVFVGIHNSDWAWWLYMGLISLWGSLWMVFHSGSAHTWSLYLLPWAFCAPF